jgi:hypothetical protein
MGEWRYSVLDLLAVAAGEWIASRLGLFALKLVG